MTSAQPSAASSSATARPSPRLEPPTRATFPPSPRSMLAAVEVGVRVVQPVLARRVEDVHVERVLQRLRLVPHVRRDVQHLTAPHDDPFPAVLADAEAQRALQDVRELLVVML